jgi:plastocyanin
MPLGRRQLRRQAARLALAITAGCAPVVAVMAGSWTGLAGNATFYGYGAGAQVYCMGRSYCWSPSTQTLATGEMATWTGAGHGLEKLSSTSPWPADCLNGAGTCTFSQPGTYYFQCIYHHEMMKGTLTVTGSAPPPPPMKPPAPPPPPPTHPAMSPRSQPPAAVAAPPTPSPSPVPSPSPSDTSQALAAPSDSSTARSGSLGLASSPTGSSGGFPTGLLILGLVVLLGSAGAAVYFVRIRKPDTPGS